VIKDEAVLLTCFKKEKSGVDICIQIYVCIESKILGKLLQCENTTNLFDKKRKLYMLPIKEYNLFESNTTAQQDSSS